MTQTLTKYEGYEADLQAFDKALGSGQPAWLRDIRQKAWSRFVELGLPTARRGNEPWKYTNVAPVANASLRLALEPSGGVTSQDIQRVAPWDEDWNTLVFIDGRYSEALSNAPESNGLQAGSLAEAVRSDGSLAEKHLARYESLDEDGFMALNTAFISDGAFVHIPEGNALDAPLHLVFVSTDRGEPTVSHPRVLVVAGPGSRATLIESYIGLSDNRYLTNVVTELVLEEGAALDHYRLMQESGNAFHVGMARVHQSDDSTYNSRVFEKQVGLGRLDLYAEMDGPGGYCDLKGLYFTTGMQHVDNYININHVKPSATSRLYYKGILDGRSRAVFGGTVYVQPGAIKTDSRQEDKNLVLSPNAEADSKPALFIYADDVKCGHGATAGNIDQDTVFYMRSRGIDLETASRLLIYGFASEIIDTVEEERLHDYLEKLFLESLPSYKFEF
jgi:Fe-S cluster assembly protein SufD